MVHYRNVFHAFYTIARYDGIAALQKGLVPGLYYQIVMNGLRLGSYQILTNAGFTRNQNGSLHYGKCMLAGAMSGCTGAFFGSPMYMIKTQLQAEAAETIAVGTQHHHKGFIHAVRITIAQHGFLGLWRGVTGALPRVTVGSAAQLSSFSKAKEEITNRRIFPEGSIFTSLTASMVGSVFVVVAMTPFDVISTRLYNQNVTADGRGTLYSGFLDCSFKIFKKEGLFGFYKGIGASYFRLGPHTILSLVFWDKLRGFYVNSFK